MLMIVLQQVDSGGQGGPGDAQEDVHSPRQPGHRRAVDAEDRLLPQTEAHQQHIRQARTGKFSHSTLQPYSPLSKHSISTNINR